MSFLSSAGARLPDGTTDAEDEFTPSHEIPFNKDMNLYHGAQPLSSELKTTAKLIREEYLRTNCHYPRVAKIEDASKKGGPLEGIIVHKAVFANDHAFWRYFMDCRLFSRSGWLGLVAHSQKKGKQRAFTFPAVVTATKVKVRGEEIKNEASEGVTLKEEGGGVDSEEGESNEEEEEDEEEDEEESEDPQDGEEETKDVKAKQEGCQ